MTPYNHDGEATEFFIQTESLACGHQIFGERQVAPVAEPYRKGTVGNPDSPVAQSASARVLQEQARLESNEVYARCRHERGKLSNQILRFENNCARSISPRTFQTIQEPSIGQCCQAFRSHGRPARVAAESLQAHTITGFDTYISRSSSGDGHFECFSW